MIGTNSGAVERKPVLSAGFEPWRMLTCHLLVMIAKE
jgi:hypothetical protein